MRSSRLPERPARSRSVVLLAFLVLSGTTYVACGSAEDRTYGTNTVDGTGGDNGETGGSAGSSSGNGGNAGAQQGGTGGSNPGGGGSSGGSAGSGETGGTAGSGEGGGAAGGPPIRDGSDDGPLSNTP
ncbi:MAG TPA: hypothetical protein VHE30_15545 [Polyangiaceae bacterium]|nr:hypothetical protein [Polyangiaceae bacterium]